MYGKVHELSYFFLPSAEAKIESNKCTKAVKELENFIYSGMWRSVLEWNIAEQIVHEILWLFHGIRGIPCSWLEKMIAVFI